VRQDIAGGRAPEEPAVSRSAGPAVRGRAAQLDVAAARCGQDEGEIPDILTRLWEELLFERMTPQQAAEQFVNEANAAIGG
jgi:hypothetical protein